MHIVNKQIHTEMNRYPLLFGNAYLYRKQHMPTKIKILSFGCSTGEEITSLNQYFSDDLIFGCDINISAVEIAQKKFSNHESITIFESNFNNLEKYGPYDIIFANSVLCVNTNKSDILKGSFSFQTFENIISHLALLLSSEGLLCLYNTSYFPDESDMFSSMLVPIRSHFVSMGYVPRFDRNGLLVLDRVVEHGRGYYARQNEKIIDYDIANVFYTNSKNVSNYTLDYSQYCLWTEMGYETTVPENLINKSENIIWEKIIYHYSKEYANSELLISPKNKELLGKVFLPEVLYKVPYHPKGFGSLCRY